MDFNQMVRILTWLQASGDISIKELPDRPVALITFNDVSRKYQTPNLVNELMNIIDRLGEGDEFFPRIKAGNYTFYFYFASYGL